MVRLPKWLLVVLTLAVLVALAGYSPCRAQPGTVPTPAPVVVAPDTTPVLVLPPLEEGGDNGVCGPPGRVWAEAEFLLWWQRGFAVPPLVTTSPAGTPRAFRVPYSRDLADRIVHAKERIEQGKEQAGTARDLDLPESEPDADRRLAGAPPREGEPASTGDPTAFIQHMPSIEFEDMPPPALPPKQPR